MPELLESVVNRFFVRFVQPVFINFLRDHREFCDLVRNRSQLGKTLWESFGKSGVRKIVVLWFAVILKNFERSAVDLVRKFFRAAFPAIVKWQPVQLMKEFGLFYLAD